MEPETLCRTSPRQGRANKIPQCFQFNKLEQNDNDKDIIENVIQISTCITIEYSACS